MSLRVRVALASVAGALVVLLAAGAALSSVLARQQYRDVDRQLTVVSDSLRPALLRAAQTGSDSADPGGTDGLGLKPGGTDTLRERLTARVAEATGLSYTALAVSGGQVVAQTGASRLDTASLVTAATGFSTVDAAGTRVRVRSQTTAGRTPVQVVVAVPLAPTDQRVSGLRRSVLVVGLLAVLASAALGWLLAGPAVRPLRRLRQRADEVGRVDPAQRPPWPPGTPEVDDVAAALDALDDDLALARAREVAALESARGFASTAGHELRTPLTSMSTDLAVLQAHPDLPEADRADVVASLVRGERRLRETLQALEQLARGELVSADQLAPVDLVDLALQAADDARRHHRSGPAVTVEVDVPDRAVVVVGWAAGLRLALDNLVTNAVRHGVAGRPGVLVRVAVRPSPTGGAELTVEDDGPGVPDDERSRVLGRFVRGRSAAGTGSGLGLALVDQQVRLHGGRLTLTASPLGGLAVRVDLPSGEKPAPAAT